MDFDILAPGHGPLGDKSDVTAMQQYANDLHNAVLEQIKAGKTLGEAQAAITLDAYKDWAQYEDFLPLNIEGMYNRLVLQRPGN
jgi:hypothetical protein